MEYRDTDVMGAGPAGLTAGVYLVYSSLDTVILEENIAGGYNETL